MTLQAVNGAVVLLVAVWVALAVLAAITNDGGSV